jgi:two-component system NarL family sensor kinase
MATSLTAHLSRTRLNTIAFALVPMVLSILVIGYLFLGTMRELESRQVHLQEEAMLAARRDELKNYVKLGLTSIDRLYRSGRDDPVTRRYAMDILRAMNFGEDGYFFIYNPEGVNLMHPRMPEIEGTSLINMHDANHVYVIRELIKAANAGGGFVKYLWSKPSAGQSRAKLAYVVRLDRWDWIIGTGLYLDDIQTAENQMRDDMLLSMQDTLGSLALVTIVATLLVSVTGLVLNISQRRQANLRLKLLANRVVTSQEEERARVSRELHDHVCQMLVSIKYQFELAAHQLSCESPAFEGRLMPAISSLSQAIGEVRRISHNLRPALLDDLGLPAAMHLLSSELAVRNSFEISVNCRVKSLQLSADQTVELFRIAEEALGNIERHAQASRVQIELLEQEDGVHLRVEDDGVGFDIAQTDQGQGIGLPNMRERAERIGAALDIHSCAQGTRIAILVPKGPQKATA